MEVGYGLGEAYRGNGYMAEAVRAMRDWALAQPGVACVVAETDADNQPSQNVLARCGFEIYKRDKSLWWRYPQT